MTASPAWQLPFLSKKPFYFGVFVVLLFLTSFPFFAAKGDLWDANIVDYAYAINDFSGIKVLTLESGWFFIYFFIKAVYFLQSALGIDYNQLHHVFAVIAIVLVSLEAKAFCKNTLNYSEAESSAVSLCVVGFGVWYVLFMSLLIVFVLCAGLLLTGYRLIQHKNMALALSGYLVLLVSFQLGSNLTFLFGIAFCDWLLNRHGPGFGNPRIKRVATALTLAVFYFWISKYVFSPTGPYDGYNKVVLPLSKDELLGVWSRFLNYPSYLIYLLTALVAIHLVHDILLIVLPRQSPSIGNDRILEEIARDRRRLLASLVLFLSASIPYILVGKAPELWDFLDWSERHALLLSMPLGVGLVAVVNLANQFARSELMKKVAACTALLCFLALNYWALYTGALVKLYHSALNDSMVEALKVIGPIEPGTVSINATVGARKISLSAYELNWLFYRAYGEAKWYVTFSYSMDDSIRMPSIPIDKLNYRIFYVMKDFEDKCHTELLLRLDKYRFRLAMRYIRGQGPLPSVELEKGSVICFH